MWLAVVHKIHTKHLADVWTRHFASGVFISLLLFIESFMHSNTDSDSHHQRCSCTLAFGLVDSHSLLVSQTCVFVLQLHLV